MAFILFGVVSITAVLTDHLEAGKKTKPQCMVVRTAAGAELPPRNAGVPQGVSINTPITFAGHECVAKNATQKSCAFFYDENGNLKCKPLEVSL